jgi:predicted site-specific integrase-resolvase
VESVNDEFQIKFVDAGTMGDLLGVKAKHVRIWARQDKIPKLVLPNGRFAFNPNAVIETLKASKGETNGEG